MAFIELWITKKQCQKAVKRKSKEDNIPYDESILEDKQKMREWLVVANNLKLRNNGDDKTSVDTCKSDSSSNSNNYNPASGLPMNGNIDISGNPFGVN